MLPGQTLSCLIILLSVVESVCTFEIFIGKTKDDREEKVEDLGLVRNQSYEIPLFQTRYITLRTHWNDFQRSGVNVIGLQFQIESTMPDIVSIRRELRSPAKNKEKISPKTILAQDLYIAPRKNALGHIFNAYPSPKLIHSKQKSIDNPAIDSTWPMEGLTMNIINLTFRLDVFYDNDQSISLTRSLSILITQPKRRIDKAFHFVLTPFTIASSILMGTLLDLHEIGRIMEKPRPVLIGFVAQYGLMPFLAMAIAKLFYYTPLYGLALFVIGCCPGSGASNQWTVVLDGDVNLSVMMSFISTCASFIMMPLYFYTFGKLYMIDLAIRVPFVSLACSLALVVLPYGLGILISFLSPKTRVIVQKNIKPVMIIILSFFLTFTLFVFWYLFKTIDLYTTLTAPLLPYMGFFLGALLAKMSQLEWKHVKTIGIEAGIQNVGIASTIIIYSFPQPYATRALIVPSVVSMLTALPLWIILIVRHQMKKCHKRRESNKCQTDGILIISHDKSSVNGEINPIPEDRQRL